MKKSLTVRVDAEMVEQLEVLALVNGRTVSEELRDQLAKTIAAAQSDPYLPQRLLEAVAGESRRVQRLTEVAKRLSPRALDPLIGEDRAAVAIVDRAAEPVAHPDPEAVLQI